MKDVFSINDVALMTGLTTRTIRNYITLGFLSGEKVDGAWSFSAEQVEAFLGNSAVQPAIRTRKNSIVFDFMGTKPFNGDKMCMVLDLNGIAAQRASLFFCERISACKPEGELNFASYPLGGATRLILSGSPRDVMGLMNQYYSSGAQSDVEA